MNGNDSIHQLQTDDFRLKVGMDLVRQQLELLFEPDEWIEFRSFQGQAAASHCYYTTLGRVRENDSDLRKWIDEHNSDIWRGIYFGVNARKSRHGSGVRGMSKDVDVKSYRALFVDFDDANYSEALARLQATSLPAPTLAVSSGRLSGTHFYWVFEEPIDDEVIWIGLQKTLISTLHSDASIHNPSRIMRLAGTFNYARENDCRIRFVGKKLTRWDDLGIEPERVFTPDDAPPRNTNIPPSHKNLNATTQKFLDEPCGAGNRNLTLFAAAMDYNGNGFPVKDALKELGDDRAVARDGLNRGEAYRTIHNAYKRAAKPTNAPNVIIGGDTDRFSNAMVFLSIDRGNDAKGWDFDADLEWLEAPTPVDMDPEADHNTRGRLDVEPIRVRRTDDEDDTPIDVEDLPPWQFTYKNSSTVKVANCHKEKVQTGKKTTTITYAKSAREIGSEIYSEFGKWPKYCEGLGPFFLIRHGKNAHRVHTPRNPSDLFSVFHSHGTVYWPSTGTGVTISQADRSPATLVTKGELFEYLSNTPLDEDHHYESISYFPQFPVNPSTFYVPLQLPKPTGEHLRTLVDAMNADSPIDRQLLLAALLTPGWGGPPGTRPLFIFTSDYGQGSGKTETAKLIGNVWGGAVALDASLPWETLTKSIMSSPDYLSRCFLFDNLKGRFSAASIEAGITAQRISGHRMYHGTVTRPNDATFMVTYNMPELSRDLAQRAIVIKLGKPSNANFIVWANTYLRKYRLELLADIMSVLGRDGSKVAEESGTRWRAWQEGVLAKIPGIDVDAVTATIRERQGFSDGERSDGVEIALALRSYLVAERRTGADGGDFSDSLTAHEVHAVLEAAGVWKSRENVSQAAARQACMRYARTSLMGARLLGSPDSSRDKVLVRVDSDGRPIRSRGDTRSSLVAFPIEQVDGYLREQGVEPGDGDDETLPGLPPF